MKRLTKPLLFMLDRKTEVYLRRNGTVVEFGSPADDTPLFTTRSPRDVVSALRQLALDIEGELALEAIPASDRPENEG
jgi:hypothetical protein